MPVHHNVDRAGCYAVLRYPCSDNPSIMDYLKLKHEVAEIEKQLADWKRKVRRRRPRGTPPRGCSSARQARHGA